MTKLVGFYLPAIAFLLAMSAAQASSGFIVQTLPLW